MLASEGKKIGMENLVRVRVEGGTERGRERESQEQRRRTSCMPRPSGSLFPSLFPVLVMASPVPARLNPQHDLMI